MEPILEVTNLIKHFGTFTAVDDISFSVKEGEIVGLLGPNGAGKTTTINLLLGLIAPSSGSVAYFGKDFPHNREYCLSRINFASAYSSVNARLSVRENLTIFAGLYAISDKKKRIQEVLSILEIESLIDVLFWKLSSGQKTRVILAKALLNRPRLILMDEPTASLDPEIANKVVELIMEMQKKEKVTILYTSHNMAEVERLCDQVIFLHKGKIIAEDSPLELTKRVGRSFLTVTFDGKKGPVETYLLSKKHPFRFVGDHAVEVTLNDRDMPKVLFGLSERGVWLTEIDVQKPNLEDVFLSFAKGNYEYTES